MLSPWGCSDTEEAEIPRMLSPRSCRTAPQRAPKPGSPPAAPSLVACQAGRALGADSAAGWSPAAPRYRRRAPICTIAALGAFQILLPRGAALTHGGSSGGGHAPHGPLAPVSGKEEMSFGDGGRRGERWLLGGGVWQRLPPRSRPSARSAGATGISRPPPPSQSCCSFVVLRVSPRDICPLGGC